MITRAPLPADEIVAIGSQIADALDAAWSRGIVHRDIKPANIMVTPRGHVKVLDFGLARMQMAEPEKQETQLLTVAGALLGTVQYMSPEQALGRDIDGRSDIFSLGVVLYEMATGRLPFTGPGSPEIIAKILNEQPEAMARFNYSLPQESSGWSASAWRKIVSAGISRRAISGRLAESGARPSSEFGLRRARFGQPCYARHRGDDEELARAVIREFANATHDLEVVAECANGFEAVKAIADHEPDLVFLDVQMPKLDGFEVLELIDRDVAGDLLHGVRSVRHAGLRRPRGRLPAEALQPGTLSRRPWIACASGSGDPTPHGYACARAFGCGPAATAVRARIVVKDGARVHVIPLAARLRRGPGRLRRAAQRTERPG